MEIKSTNINKTNNYISFQMIKKKTTTYVDGNPVPGLGLAQTCIWQYIEEWDQKPYALLIIGSATTIQIHV